MSDDIMGNFPDFIPETYTSIEGSMPMAIKQLLMKIVR